MGKANGRALAHRRRDDASDLEDEPTRRRSRADVGPSYSFRAPDPVCGNHIPLLAHHYARPSTPPHGRRAPPRPRTTSVELPAEKLLVLLTMSAAIGLPSIWLTWLLVDALLPI